MCLQAQESRDGAKADWPQARPAGTEDTPSPPSDGGEGRGEEGRWEPLSSVLSPLLRRGARKKWRASKYLRRKTTFLWIAVQHAFSSTRCTATWQRQTVGCRADLSFLSGLFPFLFDQRFQPGQFFRAQFAGFQEALHHRRQRAVERVPERVEQLAALRLFARHRRAVERQVAKLFRGQQALGHHPVHQRADGAVGPFGLFVQLLLDGRGRARFVLPDRLDDRPFGFGQFDVGFRHRLIVDRGEELSTVVEVSRLFFTIVETDPLKANGRV